jgi:hypothetical protein
MDTIPAMWRKEGKREALCDVTLWLRDDAASILSNDPDFAELDEAIVQEICVTLALKVQKRIEKL